MGKRSCFSPNNLQINKTNINTSKDVSSCHPTENKGFGVVPKVGNSAVPQVVPPTENENYSTYPHPASKDPAACKNRATKCKEGEELAKLSSEVI